MTDQPSTTDAPPSSPPPRGPSLKMIGAIVALLAVTLWVGVVLAPYVTQTSANKLDIAAKQIERLKNDGAIDEPTFQQVKQAIEASAALQKNLAAEAKLYTCGMHPWVILPKPGTCPICQMELVPIDPQKFSGEVTIDPVIVQNIGVRIAPVKTGPLTRRIRTVGTVDYDETRVRDVNIKVPGWIEKLHVDYLGAQVNKGDTLFDFYSPDLYAAQEEYLLALKNRGRIGADFVPAAAQGAKKLVEDARTRLLYFDITAPQIKELEQRGKPSKTLAIQSPHTGVVIAKHANEGMKVDQGMRVYRIADLSKIWVMVTLYEYQLPYVQLGQHAVMSLSYIPGQTFEGKVIYIYPYLDKRTREVQVRLEFANPHLLLKPGMFANVDLESTLAQERTLAPRAAIIDTGQRQVAFVSLGEGKFEPRNVIMGVENGDGFVEIIDGLKPGEMVVTSGQFLIDSEANIRETLSKMIRGESAGDQQAVAAVAGTSEISTLPDEVAEGLIHILNSYFLIGNSLADDSVTDIGQHADKIAKAVDLFLETRIPANPHFWHQHEEVATVRGKALELVGADELDNARLHFADLSIALGKLLKATGVPPDFAKDVQQLHCPMYRGGQGGSTWLQPAGAVRNPFYGASMLECFDERLTLPITGQSTGK